MPLFINKISHNNNNNKNKKCLLDLNRVGGWMLGMEVCRVGCWRSLMVFRMSVIGSHKHAFLSVNCLNFYCFLY